LSGERSEDEGLFVRQHEYWAKTLIAAIDSDDGNDGGTSIAADGKLKVAA
jgi:benzoate/toluate 1,2-dioxygenase alpha subunit